MAKLASAREVRRYTYTNGNEPELQDNVPVWAIQLRGAITFRAWTEFNPLCVVKNGTRIIFAPYGGEGPNGIWLPPDDAGFKLPELALPPLAP